MENYKRQAKRHILRGEWALAGEYVDKFEASSDKAPDAQLACIALRCRYLYSQKRNYEAWQLANQKIIPLLPALDASG